jgi:hypothetical protein
MSDRDDFLPEELLWADAGHASDVVLTAIADGEEAIVPEVARRHVHACVHCTQALGRVALLSLHAGDELEVARPLAAELLQNAQSRAALAKEPEPKRFQIPWFSVAIAAVLAVVGSVPMLVRAPSDIADNTHTAVRGLPLAIRHAFLAIHAAAQAGEAQLVLNVGTALLLVTMAALVARRFLRANAHGARS